MYKIYLITNNVNGKVYVGQTKYTIEQRFAGHIACANNLGKKHSVLHNAIKKYGSDNFKVELLEDNLTEANVDEREIFWISYYKSRNRKFGYNITEGGGGVKGYHHSDETKQKISKSTLRARDAGKIYTPERNRKISLAQKGKKKSESWYNNLLVAMEKRDISGDKNPFYGKTHSVITRNKVSDANTKHHVLQIDAETGEVLRKFKNRNEAARWVLEQGLTTALLGTCSGRIGFVCADTKNTNRVAYGYRWKYEEECND